MRYGAQSIRGNSLDDRFHPAIGLDGTRRTPRSDALDQLQFMTTSAGFSHRRIPFPILLGWIE
jgi:hypothetical protein